MWSKQSGRKAGWEEWKRRNLSREVDNYHEVNVEHWECVRSKICSTTVSGQTSVSRHASFPACVRVWVTKMGKPPSIMWVTGNYEMNAETRQSYLLTWQERPRTSVTSSPCCWQPTTDLSLQRYACKKHVWIQLNIIRISSTGSIWIWKSSSKYKVFHVIYVFR